MSDQHDPAGGAKRPKREARQSEAAHFLARVSEISGHTTTYVREKMAYAEALQYDQIWWLRFNERRQSMAFSPVPRLVLVRPGEAYREERV